MFVVGDILVSDDLAEEAFVCNLGACRGACCVHGDSGAPLEQSELAELEQVVSTVRKYLSREALAIIDSAGPWERLRDGRLATQCLSGRDCVFVTYEGPVAKCSIQIAHEEGRTDFKKPISCHLFPARAVSYDTYEVLNYEHVGICDSARAGGRKKGMMLAEFLREPLIRKYGDEWYEQFTVACEERRCALAGR